MTELAAGFATLSVFLMWRLHVVNRHARVITHMLTAMVDGKVEIRRTEKGIEMEIKDNG